VHDETSQTRARGRTAGAARTTPDDAHTGRVLDGRYQIRGRIARGGMASVYEALDLRLDRTVAVKIMHAGLGDATAGDEEFAARFVREARSAARLSHPNVVSVFDQGEDQGTVYLAMELVPGHTLRDTIAKEAPMSPERALALLDPVLSALGSAHRAGLVHRDVKPENVLIADDGRIKVADFGLAKAISADTQHTATNGVLIGTVSYLAPELVIDGQADARADVYAAGVILFELLTGRKPHTGETPIAVAYKHVHQDVPAPSSEVPGIPDYVDALVARATCRDRTLRPADAGVLLHHAHRVTQALHAGVREDPELVADLLPSARVDTTPEPVSQLWDESLFAERAHRASRESTSVIEQPAARRTPPPAEPDRAAPAPAAGPPRRRRGMVLLLLAALVAAAVGGGAYWFGWARYTSTPSVVGLEQTAAERELEDAGLEVEVTDPIYSESVPKGEVIESDPSAGERILPDGTVTLTVSLGPERYDVPDLSGMTVEQAQAALAEHRLLLGRQTERWSETVDKGQVIRSDPRFDSKAAKDLPVDSTVDVVVSKGREPIQVESWVGRDAGEAKEAIKALGLKVDVVGREHSDTVAEGGVIDQDPVEGTLYKGDTVELVVSMGPELVEVPGVFGQSTEEAISELEAAGLEVQVERAQIYFDGTRAWSTNPGAGDVVPEGSTVTLYVV